MIKRKRTKG